MFHRPCALLLSAASLVTPIAAAPGIARAEVDPDVARLADGRSQRSNVSPTGQSYRYGRAEVLVHAPLDSVKERVLDFAHYKDLVPDKFHNARVVGRDDDGTRVYMQVPVMRGLVTLWQVMIFRDLQPLAKGWAIVEGFFEKGNLKAANTTWSMRAIDATTTLLTLDLLIVPQFPAPQSAIDEELRDAAAQAVDAVRDRAQPTPGPVPYSAPPPGSAR